MKTDPLKDPLSVKNILFISLGGIGNLIFLTPAVSILCRKYPNARVSFLLSKSGAGEIVKNHPRLNLLYEMEKPGSTLLPFFKKMRSIKPDITFVATGMNPLKSGLVSVIAGAPCRVGERFGAGRVLYNVAVPYRFRQHEVACNLAMAGALDRDLKHSELCTIWSTPKDAEYAANFLSGERKRADQKFIGIHPGSGANMTFKRWPIENFIKVSKEIIRHYNAKILVFGGREESALARALCEALGSDAVNCAGTTTVLQSFEVIKRCILFLSNDSSPLHMAAVAKIPVVAIFGPTSEVRTGPWGVPHRLAMHPVPCHPCYPTSKQKNGIFKCRNEDQFACLNHVTVETVLSHVHSLLGETAHA